MVTDDFSTSEGQKRQKSEGRMQKEDSDVLYCCILSFNLQCLSSLSSYIVRSW